MESLTTQTTIAISNAVESPYGVPDASALLATGYTSMRTRSRDLPVTDSEKTDDRGTIGAGNAMYPSYQRSGFRVPVGFSFEDIMHVGNFLILLRRYMGAVAAAPAVVEAAVAFRHTFYEQNPDTDGLQLPSSSIVYKNNEYDYLHLGCVGATLQVSQTGTGDPTFAMGMATSGNAKRIALDYPTFGALAVPAVNPYMYGTSSSCQYTDDAAATVNLTTPSHKLRALSFSANNALITDDTRMGMPQVDAAEPRRGWYRDFLHFGDRDVSFEFTMGMDGDYSLKNAEELNLVYTNLAWAMRGDLISGTATANKYEAKLVIPKFHLRAPRTGEDGGKRTKTFAVFPVTSAGQYGVYRWECINGVSTAIV